jgi:hypothetical protein
MEEVEYSVLVFKGLRAIPEPRKLRSGVAGEVMRVCPTQGQKPAPKRPCTPAGFACKLVRQVPSPRGPLVTSP